MTIGNQQWSEDQPGNTIEVLDRTESEVDENGMKTVTEIRFDSATNTKTRVTQRVKVTSVTQRVKKSVLERRNMPKFGLAKESNEGVTYSADEVTIETKARKAEEAEKSQGASAGHEFMSLMGKKAAGSALAPAKPASAIPLPSAQEIQAQAAMPGAAKYTFRRQMGVGGPGGEDRPVEFTIRVSNLPLHMSRDDQFELKDLFQALEPTESLNRRPFGTRRAELLRFKVLAEKGIAFASFATKEEAEKAMEKYDDYGFMSCRLHCEWAK
eukprot:ANDGO_08117.mRNA.1 Eukaryotic translation initiation factor 3 subunit G